MNTDSKNWYAVNNIADIDSPALIIYKERVRNNIRNAIAMVKNPARLRPHVKTNKMADVCRMMMEEGITKFKCATIAEAEMLAAIKAPDVLFAFQPVGPKINRLCNLVEQYPATTFSCLIDHSDAAKKISDCFQKRNLTLNVYLDLNVGMNRSGVTIDKAPSLFEKATQLPNINMIGLHVYDGHITDANIALRKQQCDAIYREIQPLVNRAESRKLTIIAGGSPTFSIHAQKKDVECSPGTFVFWDWSYKSTYPDEPFEYAALVVARIVSIIDGTRFCIDLGHKSVASEKPLPRVHFFNTPEAEPVSHSEEHMVVKVPNTSGYSIGDVLYGVPVHICPTVSMYERAFVIENGNAIGEWEITARNKRISF